MQQKTVVTIVKGYHYCTPVPDTAVAERLLNRFAVIINTPLHNDSDFDSDFFCELLDELFKTLDHDELSVHVGNNVTLKSFDDLRTYYERTNNENRNPPVRVVYKRSGEIVCLEETEFWALCGGPYPYCDFNTAAFYTRSDMSIPFERSCVNACKSTGCIVEEVVYGSTVPIELPWWKRFLRRME